MFNKYKNILKFYIDDLLKNRIYTDKNGLTKGCKRRGIKLFQQTKTLSGEEDFLLNFNFKNQTIYDLGSSEGLLTYFFSKSVGKIGFVVAFEPNPKIFKKLNEMIRLNSLSNVKSLNIGLGRKNETKQLMVPLDSGRGSMVKEIQKQISKEKEYWIFQAEIFSIDGAIDYYTLPKPDFIKIDVEGMEYNVLLGMKSTIKKYKPKILIEIHGADIKQKLENAFKIVEFFEFNNYSIYHVESQKKISRENYEIAMSGHIFCN